MRLSVQPLAGTTQIRGEEPSRTGQQLVHDGGYCPALLSAPNIPLLIAYNLRLRRSGRSSSLSCVLHSTLVSNLAGNIVVFYGQV